MLVVMIGIALGELLNDIAGGRIPSGLLWILIGLKMPDIMGTIIPLSIFVAIIWGLGRFYRDQEMSVMRSSGFNWQMMLRPLFNLLMPVAAALLLNGLFLSPVAASAVLLVAVAAAVATIEEATCSRHCPPSPPQLTRCRGSATGRMRRHCVRASTRSPGAVCRAARCTARTSFWRIAPKPPTTRRTVICETVGWQGQRGRRLRCSSRL